MIKILTVIGTRPQFVKAAIVSKELKKSDCINEIIIHTGQHFDQKMSAIFFEEMEIPVPIYNLNINGLNHGAMTGQMIEEIEKICLIEKPDFLMVYGDTNSTLAGALAAKKLQIKVVHIEAGLRSYNMKMPEEINRTLTDKLSDILFCPTQKAVENLNKEGILNSSSIKIVQCGDVMYDAAKYYHSLASKKSTIIRKMNLEQGNYVVCTFHRQENTENSSNLKSIITALNTIHKQFPVICPIHPRTKKLISENKIKCDFNCIEPVGYFDMLELIKNSNLVLTDSGGLQKEAYFFNKYCITLRDETEWEELVNYKYNFLVGTNPEKIIKTFSELVSKEFTKTIDLYGNGNSCEKIRLCLESEFKTN